MIAFLLQGRSMKNKRYLATILSLALILTTFSFVGTFKTFAATNTQSVSVLDFRAVGSDTRDDTAAFQAALDCAENASSPVTVNIPAGTYYLSGGLMIWSNTIIKAAPGAKMISTLRDGNMLCGVHHEPNGSKCTGLGSNFRNCKRSLYSHGRNITIDGGVWDRNCRASDNTCILSIIHSDGITIRNATFMNSTNHHINLSGSKNVTVENCVFKNTVKYTGNDSSFWLSTNRRNATAVKERYAQLEAIHLDHINAYGEPSKYPQDGTPCRDIAIRNCTFDNVGAGAGTHNTVIYDTKKYANCGRASNLSVENCHFSNIWGHMVNFGSYTNSRFVGDGAAVTSAAAICRVANGSASISNINLVGKDGDIGPAIQVTNKSAVSLNNISIDGRSGRGQRNCLVYIDSGSDVKANNIKVLNGDKGKSAIAVVNSSKLTLNKAVIKAPKHQAVYANKARRLIVSASNISGARDNGIYISSSSGIDIRNSKISSTKKNGIYVTDSKNVKIRNNKIYSSGLCAISQLSTKKSTISGNTISGSKNVGIMIAGASKKKYSTVNITKNTVKSRRSKSAVFLKGYCKNCKVTYNKLGGKGLGNQSKYRVKQAGNKK